MVELGKAIPFEQNLQSGGAQGHVDTIPYNDRQCIFGHQKG